MDPIRNPYAPGAGTQPPELAGRDRVRETIRISLARTRLGKPTKSVILIGLRGVGKTVLLDRMREDAESKGIHTLRIEAPENRSLPSLLAPQLRQGLLRLSHNARAKNMAERALRGLAGFAKSLKAKYADIEVGIDFEPEPGLADNGDLEHDLQALLEVVGGRFTPAARSSAIQISTGWPKDMRNTKPVRYWGEVLHRGSVRIRAVQNQMRLPCRDSRNSLTVCFDFGNIREL